MRRTSAMLIWGECHSVRRSGTLEHDRLSFPPQGPVLQRLRRMIVPAAMSFKDVLFLGLDKYPYMCRFAFMELCNVFGLNPLSPSVCIGRV